MTQERLFPIQSCRDAAPHPTTIPWAVADLAYSVHRSRYGSGQSLEQIAERHGFSADEMDRLLPDWRERSSALAQVTAERDEARRKSEIDEAQADAMTDQAATLAARLAEVERERDSALNEAATVRKLRDEMREALARTLAERDEARATLGHYISHHARRTISGRDCALCDAAIEVGTR